MKCRTLVLVLVAALLGSACSSATRSAAQNPAAGNGRIEHLRLPVSGLAGLDVGDMGRLNVTLDVVVGDRPKLDIEGDRNLLGLLESSETDDTLRIRMNGDPVSAHPVHIRYTVPRIARIKTAGSVQASVKGLQEQALRLEHSGASKVVLEGTVRSLSLHNSGGGDVRAESLACNSADIATYGSGNVFLGKVEGGRLSISASGALTIAAVGQVDDLRADVSGAVRLSLAALQAHTGTLSANGTGGAEINVTDRVGVTSSGSTRVRIHGNPRHRTVKGNDVAFL